MLALSVSLTGCWNGYQALTTQQSTGGEVAEVNVGDVQARGLIWVQDPADPKSAYMSGTFLVPTGGQADELTAVRTDPKGEVAISGGPVALEPGASKPVQIGYNSSISAKLSGAELPQSAFVATTLVFKTAGEVTVPVLLVPATGPYAKAIPNGAASGEAGAEATPGASGEASPGASGEASPAASGEASPAEASPAATPAP